MQNPKTAQMAREQVQRYCFLPIAQFYIFPYVR